jgi:hypothetical protein
MADSVELVDGATVKPPSLLERSIRIGGRRFTPQRDITPFETCKLLELFFQASAGGYGSLDELNEFLDVFSLGRHFGPPPE